MFGFKFDIRENLNENQCRQLFHYYLVSILRLLFQLHVNDSELFPGYEPSMSFRKATWRCCPYNCVLSLWLHKPYPILHTPSLVLPGKFGAKIKKRKHKLNVEGIRVFTAYHCSESIKRQRCLSYFCEGVHIYLNKKSFCNDSEYLLSQILL